MSTKNFDKLYRGDPINETIGLSGTDSRQIFGKP